MRYGAFWERPAVVLRLITLNIPPYRIHVPTYRMLRTTICKLWPMTAY